MSDGQRRLPILVVAGWLLLLFAPWWLGGRSYAAGDLLYQTSTMFDPSVTTQSEDALDNIFFALPSLDYLQKSLWQGRIPLWNPDYLLGLPSAFNGQSGYLYPLHWPLLLSLPLGAAYHLSLLLHLGLAGWSAYWLARDQKLSNLPSLLLATCWTLNPHILSWMTVFCPVVSHAWFAFLLLALGRAGRSRRWMAAAALAMAAGVLGGFLQWTFYALGISFLLRVRAAPRRVVEASLLGCLLCAFMWFPMLVHMKGSQRVDRPAEFFRSVHGQYLASLPITMLYPEAYGSPTNGFEIHRIHGYGTFIFAELCSFAGNLPNLLAVYALWRRPRLRPYAALGLLLFVLPATPVYAALARLAGPISKLNPTRLGWLLSLGVAFLSAFGLEAWLTDEGRGRRVLPALGALATLVVLGWVGWVHTHEPALTAQYCNRSSLLVPSPFLPVPEADYQAACQRGLESSFDWLNPTLLSHLLVLFLGSVILSGRPSPTRAGLLVALTGVELLVFGIAINPKVAGPIIPPNPLAPRLRALLGEHRLVGRSTIKPNQLLPEQIKTVEGYDSFLPKHSEQVISYLENQQPGRQMHMAPARFPSPWWSWMDVSHLLALVQQPQPPGWRPVPGFEPLAVWANPASLGPAFLIHQSVLQSDEQKILEEFNPQVAACDTNLPALQGSGRVLRVLASQPERVLVELEHSGGKGLLVLSQSWTQGWSARINGQLAPVLRVNLMFPAVIVDDQSGLVEWRYTPPGWPYCLALGGGALLWLAWRARRP
ncbi:hypothetical protein JST97_04040 [bacterium]|nr:hypothetical protein [bacterium]